MRAKVLNGTLRKELLRIGKMQSKNGEIKEGYEEESKALVEKMKENIGGFVTHPYYGSNDTVKRDTIYSYPKQVGIIINGRNASSAETISINCKK